MVSDQLKRTEFPDPPGWIAESPRLASAYRLAVEAHGSQRRASDRALFLEHVLEVAILLHGAGFDDELIAAGLLHDAVERGTLTEQSLMRAMGPEVSALVISLTEDASIESFDERKAALREQVSRAGTKAITIFAADKLSDIGGLCRGIELYADSIEVRIGTTVVAMAGHYLESVEMIEWRHPESVFIPALRQKLQQLEAQIATRPAPRPAG
jgi:hypothetical protein